MRYLGGLIDTISLWVSSSHAFAAWTMMATRPPLYLALPAQIFVLWRLTKADFCRAPVGGPMGGADAATGLFGGGCHSRAVSQPPWVHRAVCIARTHCSKRFNTLPLLQILQHPIMQARTGGALMHSLVCLGWGV